MHGLHGLHGGKKRLNKHIFPRHFLDTHSWLLSRSPGFRKNQTKPWKISRLPTAKRQACCYRSWCRPFLRETACARARISGRCLALSCACSVHPPLLRFLRWRTARRSAVIIICRPTRSVAEAHGATQGPHPSRHARTRGMLAGGQGGARTRGTGRLSAPTILLWRGMPVAQGPCLVCRRIWVPCTGHHAHALSTCMAWGGRPARPDCSRK